MTIQHVYLSDGRHFLTDGVERGNVALYDSPAHFKEFMALTDYYSLHRGVYQVNATAAITRAIGDAVADLDVDLLTAMRMFRDADAAELAQYIVEPGLEISYEPNMHREDGQ